jgi:hypothetical protein
MEIKQLVLLCALGQGDCTCEPTPGCVPCFTEQLARRDDDDGDGDPSRVTVTGGLGRYLEDTGGSRDCIGGRCQL